ncbi:DUF126 domain-containing protein [Bacillus sp. JJ1566]|uniref:aconitase X swivel domain-containing protein n=1 Tax=Bacillus sp. JJ1566 TaxID=3122961 RepID=UPI003000D94C
MEFQGKELLTGSAKGHTLILEASLNLWNGIDSKQGIIVQSGHPQEGQSIVDTILVFAKGLSGATAGISLTECLRTGHGPVAMVLPEVDVMVVCASVVAGELYNKQIPILQVASEDIIQIPNGIHAEIKNGILTADKSRIRGNKGS